jgi:hypothetical protein
MAGHSRQRGLLLIESAGGQIRATNRGRGKVAAPSLGKGLQWKPPARARVVVLQPLGEDKMGEFLKTRYDSLGIKEQIDRDRYEKDCEEYLAPVVSKAQPEEDRLAAQRILSNPMDSTTAAQLIAGGARPSVRELQDQQFRQMEIRYRQIHAGNDFPLRRFSESVYQARLKDEPALDAAAFFEEIQVMVQFKMALERHGEDSAGARLANGYFAMTRPVISS